MCARGADGTEQQAEISRIAADDAFNWGYDPVHYGVPEGSYASDPDNESRIVEYRYMVQVLRATPQAPCPFRSLHWMLLRQVHGERNATPTCAAAVVSAVSGRLHAHGHVPPRQRPGSPVQMQEGAC